MSEQIDNSKFRKHKLKELILKIHDGTPEEEIREELMESLKIPYGEVVEVEQELIEEGLPEDEILRLCDVHSSVLHGSIDLSGSKQIPSGHPVDVMIQENKALKKVTDGLNMTLAIIALVDEENLKNTILEIREAFNQLMDVDKHYQRKEYLFFPYLEKTGVTGPPKVMWGKHDEIRELLKGSSAILQTEDISKDELAASAELILKPAVKGVAEMIIKEEEILFPMMMDALSEAQWYEIHQQTPEIGFCLYDPPVEWKPAGLDNAKEQPGKQAINENGRIQLPTGSFDAEELLALFNTLPVDITFVDKNDKVKYFSQSKDRIFQRSRAIINRDVRYCHPPASAHIVDKILEDFKSGKHDRAPFWINMGGKMILIEYYALRNENGDYLGTLEVSQDLTEHRSLQGEQRILSYQ